jgi:hypothetical protein
MILDLIKKHTTNESVILHLLPGIMVAFSISPHESRLLIWNIL